MVGMKTLTEALKCLDKPESECKEPTRIDIYIDSQNTTIEKSSGPGCDGPSMQSLAELGREIATHDGVQEIGHLLICLMLGVGDGRPVTTSVQTANMLSSLFATAFTYGVRVGIEMEKSDEVIAV